MKTKEEELKINFWLARKLKKAERKGLLTKKEFQEMIETAGVQLENGKYQEGSIAINIGEECIDVVIENEKETHQYSRDNAVKGLFYSTLQSFIYEKKNSVEKIVCVKRDEKIKLKIRFCNQKEAEVVIELILESNPTSKMVKAMLEELKKLEKIQDIASYLQKCITPISMDISSDIKNKRGEQAIYQEGILQKIVKTEYYTNYLVNLTYTRKGGTSEVEYIDFEKNRLCYIKIGEDKIEVDIKNMEDVEYLYQGLKNLPRNRTNLVFDEEKETVKGEVKRRNLSVRLKKIMKKEEDEIIKYFNSKKISQ